MTHKLSASYLQNFSGTQNYTYGPFKRFVMTDGLVFLMANGCAWLVDAIASHQTSDVQKRADGFQVWTLQRNDNGDVNLVCTDGNYNAIVRQQIEFTDFPFERFPSGLTVYVEYGSIDGVTPCWVAMLPSER